MNANKLIAIALTALLLTAGAAAATPGESPTNDGTETAEEHRPAEAGDDATDEDEAATDEDDTEDARDENPVEGPPTDLPEPVPDHVTTIHQLIRDKLGGDLGNTTLGEAISGVVGGDGEAEDRSENAGAQSGDASAADDGGSDQAGEHARAPNAGPSGTLPEQAADHVGAIHDAITAFLNGDGEAPGDAVNPAASG